MIFSAVCDRNVKEWYVLPVQDKQCAQKVFFPFLISTVSVQRIKMVVLQFRL